MAKSFTPKFQVGDKVRVGSDPEVCEVVSYTFSDEKFQYRVKSLAIDVARKRLVEGVKHAQEDELEEVSQKELRELGELDELKEDTSDE